MLNKRYKVRRAEFMVTSVPASVIVEEEFEYAFILKDIISDGNHEIGYHSILHKPSELLDKLLATGESGSVIIYAREGTYSLTDIIITRPFKIITATYIKA